MGPSLHPRRKILQRKELARHSQELREAGGRLVLTNGCFDLLHVGHVRYLRAARMLGDALAVGINSDASVRELKGPGRPLIAADERAEILAALEAVDFVTIFTERTAGELADAVRPSIYVKGGDYSDIPGTPNFPLEGDIVHSYGGQVRVIDYVPGRSTSDLVRRVCDLGEQ